MGRRKTLRIPAVLAVAVLGGCGSSSSQHKADAKLADAARDAPRDAPGDGTPCPIDAPNADAGCLMPCGDISGSTGLCHGQEVCVDPCGNCPPGCVPLV